MFQIRVVLSLSPLEPPLRNLFCKREQLPRIPMRLACVLDVSHSMGEQYGPDPLAPCKLERVKLFARLLVQHALGNEDQLAIVTFGTTAEVVLPLKRMTEDAQVRCTLALCVCVIFFYDDKAMGLILLTIRPWALYDDKAMGLISL